MYRVVVRISTGVTIIAGKILAESLSSEGSSLAKGISMGAERAGEQMTRSYVRDAIRKRRVVTRNTKMPVLRNIGAAANQQSYLRCHDTSG